MGFLNFRAFLLWPGEAFNAPTATAILEFWEEEKPLRDEPTIKRGSFSSEDELRFKRSRLGGSGQFKTGHLGSPLSRGVILTTPKVLARDNVDE